MRTVLGSILALTVIVGFAGRSQADDARALVEQAIRSHGGAERLVKMKNMTRTAKGELSFGGASVGATCEVTAVPPEQSRWNIEIDLGGGQKAPALIVVNGAKGWRSSGGVVKEMTKLELEEPRNEGYVSWLMTLLPLREGCELSSIPDTKVADQPAAGIKVVRKGYPDVKMYFDKKTGLLVKVQRRAREAGVETDKDYLFSEPKDFEGVKLPTRHLELSNGKKVAEWGITGYKFPDKIDDKTFAKP